MESLISNLEITIPMGQIVLLLGLSIALVLFGNIKSALVANYIFIFYWISGNYKTLSKNFSINSIIPVAGSYTLIICAILFCIAVIFIYDALVE